ncbi:MAG: hypothetical protein L3J35_05490 [Bacteroidales bacterium]|nr:hypothetical protein [Bacteroidales bacterium]
MNKILIISFFTLLLSYSFAQNNIKDNSNNIIISGTVTSISLIDGSCYYYCKLKNISVIYGSYIEDTVTVKINPCATTLWRLKENEQVILSAQFIKNIYEINTEYYDFSPFYSVLKLNNSALKLYNEKDFNSLIKSYTNYFKKTRILILLY